MNVILCEFALRTHAIGRGYHEVGMVTRNTRQKAAIREAFEHSGRPLSTDEVLAIAQIQVDGLGIATVYRNIKALLDERWLMAVELPGEPARYEIAGKEHHHHFRCDECGRVFELYGCLPAIEALAAPGFSVRAHELVLYGTCADCAGLRTNS